MTSQKGRRATIDAAAASWYRKRKGWYDTRGYLLMFAIVRLSAEVRWKTKLDDGSANFGLGQALYTKDCPVSMVLQ